MWTQISPHGKTSGYILLKTLIMSVALMLLVSAALIIIAALIRHSGILHSQAEQLILNGNLQTLRELAER
ncbi:MAG: hypothetical protein LBR47_04130 [Spirochaetaceae bacterium]|jgi:hypothetical protein|nr:hypothetical protein [Spirochaetaceae bacterium]